MRLYRICPSDIAAAINRPTSEVTDESGNQRLTGSARNGRAIIVILASDDLDFVITTFPDD